MCISALHPFGLEGRPQKIALSGVYPPLEPSSPELEGQAIRQPAEPPPGERGFLLRTPRIPVRFRGIFSSGRQINSTSGRLLRSKGRGFWRNKTIAEANMRKTLLLGLPDMRHQLQGLFRSRLLMQAATISAINARTSMNFEG